MRIADVNPLLPAGYDAAWSLAIVVAGLGLAVAVAFAVWTILSSPRLTGSGRALWLVVVVALPIAGAVAWFAWGRSARLERGIL